jgi:hypothetical protein
MVRQKDMKKNILFLSIILISCTKSFNNSYDPATSAFAKNYYLYGTVVKNIIFPPPAVPIVTIPTKLVYDPSDLGFTTTQTVASTSNTIDFDSSITSVTVSPSFPTGIGFTSTSTGSAKDYRIKPSSPPTVQAATKYTITGCNVSGGCINTDITIQIVNATGNTVWGQNGFFSTSASGVGTTGLNSPKGIALDSSGGLYVVDSGNHRVLYFPVNSQTATRVYGQGGSFALANPNNGGISANSLMYPTAVAVDSSNGLYITDNSNNRILYYTSGNTTATRVYGQAGLFTTDTLVFTPSATNFNFISLNNAGALALDSNNNLYVADPARSRVLFFPNGSTTATRVYGQAGLFTTANGIRDTDFLKNSSFFNYFLTRCYLSMQRSYAYSLLMRIEQTVCNWLLCITRKLFFIYW